MAKVSPLHKVIDAYRWDAEHPLGRLILLVHAAFLDAGFVPLPHHPSSRKRRPIPRSAGRTASSLSLRYTAPELRHKRHAQASVVLRQQVYGRQNIVFFVQRGDGRPVASRCVLVDALAAGALLSGGLDATARALRRDARLAALWRGLWDALCRRALVDLCRGNGLVLEPTFLSLPDDVVLAILARVRDGASLVRVGVTCAALRRLVAEHDHELWKPRYDRRVVGRASSAEETNNCGSTATALSWKKWVRPPTGLSPRAARLISSYYDKLRIRSRRLARCKLLVLPADPFSQRRRKRRTAASGWRAAGIGRVPRTRAQEDLPRHGAGTVHAPLSSSRGQEKRRHGAGAVHAPSSRYRWKNR